MTATIQTNSKRPWGYALKHWSLWLAIVGLCIEVLLLFLCFFIDPQPIIILPHIIVIPLYSIIGIGIIGSIVFLVIWRKFEKSELEEQQMLETQKRLFQQQLVIPKHTHPLEQTEPPSLTPLSTSAPPPVTLPPVMNRPLTLPAVLSPTPPAFIVPLEGNNPKECDDKAASHGNRYAVTDGVSQSFMPAYWAGLIAQSFVRLTDDFFRMEDCAAWLRSCSAEWERWVYEDKLPLLEKEYSWMPWNEKVEQGAQTTFVGCSLFATGERTITIRVYALGDAYFFLCRRIPPTSHNEHWLEMCPLERPEGGNITSTFKTLAGVEPERAYTRIQRSWLALQRVPYQAHVGDIILLVTDKLALWIWQHLEKQDESWIELLTLPDVNAFRRFVFKERATRSLALDDTTFFMIPLTEELYQRLPKLDISVTHVPRI